MKRPLSWVAIALGYKLESQVEVAGWSIDSRTIQAGDLFFALRGPNHDGHAYVAEVFRKGAVAVVTDRTIADGELSGGGRPVFQTGDSLRALQSLAAKARQEWGGEVVAVTGSAGKTSTKEAIAALLAPEFHTAKNQGNLNNHAGLPLSLLRVPDSARVAVLEMGMNHAGEIRALAQIARPNFGVVTNVGYAHIENFDSIEGIAAAKRELIEELGPGGTAALNADDPRVAAFAEVHPGRTITYGLSPGAQIRAEDVQFEPGRTCFRVGDTKFTTVLAGRHNLSNILAGIAVAQIFGIALEKLRDPLATLPAGTMRGERFVTCEGVTIINDSYNSNPDAARAMLELLRDAPAARRIAVLGEMLELGAGSERLHRELGRYTGQLGIDVVIGIRGAARQLVDAAAQAGAREICFCDTPEEAGALLRGIARRDDAILFKGSRGVRVEKALEQFLTPKEESKN
jgi:UDP-N-acetylmuramoyl-tripeptide--D-alanyl-D-alanine ligase